MPSRRTALVIITLASATLLWRGDLPLVEPEEARYAEVPRQMLRHDCWVIPVFDHQAYLDKPPLLYWLVMASFRCCGLTITAARLVPFLASLATVLVTCWWGTRVGGWRVGAAAAGILLLTPAFLLYSPMLTMNGLLGLFVTAALASGFVALEGTSFSWTWWLLSAVCCGGGLLAKGPIALALVLPPLVFLPWVLRFSARPDPLAVLAYALVSLGIFFPWLLAVAVHEPTLWHHFLWHHHIERFLSPFDHLEPFYFYLPELLLGTMPWCLLMARYSGIFRPDRGTGSRLPGCLLLTFLWMLFFFSLSGSKRHMYLVPVYPVLAVAAGMVLVNSLRVPTATLLGIGRRGWTAAVLSLSLGLIVWRFVGVPPHHRQFAINDVIANLLNRPEVSKSPIICYPHPWPSLSFALDRDDILSFSPEHYRQMLHEILLHDQSLVVLKPGSAEEFFRELPAEVDAEEQAHNSRVQVWVIRNRNGPPQLKRHYSPLPGRERLACPRS